MALQIWWPAKGAIHHSDYVTQCTSSAYQRQLQEAGMVASMSREAMPYDNAVMESLFSSLKQQLTHHERFASLDEAQGKVPSSSEYSTAGSSCTVRGLPLAESSSRKWLVFPN